MSLNYGKLFESWELATAKSIINEYREKYRYLRQESFDDLLQDCLICWLDLRERYDPGRKASKKTFMAGVIKKELEKIAEGLKRHKRKTIFEAVSLDEPLNDDEVESTLKDKIPEDRDSPPQTETDLKIEISKVYQKLTPQQKKLCKLLSDEDLSIKEVCKQFGKQRSSVYREISRIREIFEREGLRDYLK